MAHVDFRTDPDRYKHWRLAVDGEVATLTMDVTSKTPACTPATSSR